MEVNSGGQVLFCFFAPAGTSAGHHQRAAQSVDLGNLHRSSIPSPLHSRKQTASPLWLCRYLQLPIDRSLIVCSINSQGEPVPTVPASFPAPIQGPGLAEALRALILRPSGKNGRLLLWQSKDYQCCHLRGHVPQVRMLRRYRRRWPHTTTRHTGRPWKRSCPPLMSSMRRCPSGTDPSPVP